ncbi:hypothetical protein [Paenimyroides ceti]
MGTYVECHKDEKGYKNTGAKEQCLLKPTVRYAVSPNKHEFESIESIKTLADWKTAVKNKNIYPLYDAESLANANTEAAFWEGVRSRIKNVDEKKIVTFQSIVSLCSYEALKRFDNKEVTIFEFTTDPGIKAVMGADGKVKGQTVTLNIGRLIDSTSELPQNATITVNYKDYNEREDNGMDLRTDWSDIELNGIFDVTLVQTSASATEIKFKAYAGCAGGSEQINAIEDAQIEVRDAAGALVTTSFVTADDQGVYTLTGTGFATGYTVQTVGVVTIDDENYETPQPLKIKLL